MKKIGEIKEEFAAASEGQWADLCAGYAEDQRSGVQKIVSQYQKKLENLEKEKLRMEQMMQYEHEYEHLGYLCRSCWLFRWKEAWDKNEELRMKNEELK